MEGEELLYWVRRWVPVNDGLISFACGSCSLFPFPPRANECSSTTACAASVQKVPNVDGKKEVPTAPRRKETHSSCSSEIVEVNDVSKLYVLMYAMLSSYAKIECWPLSVVIQHLLASSTEAWVQQLCVCSGGLVHAPPVTAVMDSGKLSLPQLSWSCDEVANIWSWTLGANRESWARVSAVAMSHTAAGGRCCCSAERIARPYSVVVNRTVADRSGSGEGYERDIQQPDDAEDVALLHILVNMALHFRRMKWLLKVVFLRLSVDMGDVAWRILQSCVRRMLEHNSDVIKGVLCRAALRCVRKPLCPDATVAGSSPREFESEPEASPHSLGGTCWYRFDEAHKRCVCGTPRIPLVLSVLDECGAHRITQLTTEYVVKKCQELGFALAADQLGPLCALSLRTKCDDTYYSGLAKTLDDVSRVLDGCMATLEGLRTALLAYFCGTSTVVGQDSASNNERVNEAISSFFVGFCEGTIFNDFVAEWALPLWLRACEDEQKRRGAPSAVCTDRKRSAEVPYESRVDTRSHQLTDEADNLKKFNGSDQGGRVRGAVRCPPNGGNSHDGSLSTSLRSGFITLVHFFTPETKSLAIVEATLADSVKRHLELLLAKEQGELRARFCALPQVVYQRCVFLLKLTNQLLDPLAATGCAGAPAALRAVRKGLQAFFIPREPSVILALTSALNAQVVGGRLCGPNCFSSRTETACACAPSDNSFQGDCSHYLEILDTILELASILQSRDLFIDCYCGLLAPRLMRAKHLNDLEVDIEVISRMSVRLGESVVARPLALLRDVRCSVVDPFSAPVASYEGKPFAHGLSCHVRVLCAARWDKYAPISIKVPEMRRLFESGEWFDAVMLRAVQSFERRYQRSSPVMSQGNPVREPPSRGAWSAVFFASLGQEDLDSSGGGGNAPGKARGLPHTGERVNQGTNCVPQQQRTLSWSLGSGTLAIVCTGARGAHESEGGSEIVQLFAPPITLLVLQALERHSRVCAVANSCQPSLTFDLLHRVLPLHVPKPLLGTVLGDLVRHRIVVRTVRGYRNDTDPVSEKGEVINTYTLANSFAGCKKRKIFIDLADAGHHWVPLTQEDSLDGNVPDTLCDALELDRKKRLEAGIIQLMKAQQRLPHTELFAAARRQLQAHFPVTTSIFKQCISELIDRDYLARQDADTYIYVA
ncbi:T. brucei spp.-specific protein [Trypanosoma brucei gambiense DAL972]|uniref:T. brucei spp.-specific protein n=1 Tax=Trypanosoma brucei gambiense (strain MHOM/CI/86/DAL972) TaxID=679716 RepID=D0A3B5_TRYB9|nr:T. brucei spp.-specific protein [Trypanosoma brucei gambiense DAL972]CBH15759.1 T. brucei spp.-specific protein [Trypanosoma brucei gambiense DAL972]|eukprot:XP_011778023.1 T. brucei spp.-specific protein [Trypanosoma brucei gambiense DAL972]